MNAVMLPSPEPKLLLVEVNPAGRVVSASVSDSRSEGAVVSRHAMPRRAIAADAVHLVSPFIVFLLLPVRVVPLRTVMLDPSASFTGTRKTRPTLIRRLLYPA